VVACARRRERRVEGVKGADDEGVDVDERPDGALEDFEDRGK
jgi:hypothetical protein